MTIPVIVILSWERPGGDGAGRSLVRPYAVTGGRTRPRTQLEIEAMVAAARCRRGICRC